MASLFIPIFAAAPNTPGWEVIQTTPEIWLVLRIVFFAIAFVVVSAWIASRSIAGEEAGLWRAALWVLVSFPLVVVSALIGLYVFHFSERWANVAVWVLAIVFSVCAACSIFKVNFWKAFVISFFTVVLCKVMNFAFSGFVATPEELANLKTWADRRAAAKTAPAAGSGPQTGVNNTRVDVKGTEAEWQKAAVEKYPELGLAGSRLNSMFVARVKTCRSSRVEVFQSPDWPLKLADEVAAEMGTVAK